MKGKGISESMYLYGFNKFKIYLTSNVEIYKILSYIIL